MPTASPKKCADGDHIDSVEHPGHCVWCDEPIPTCDRCGARCSSLALLAKHLEHCLETRPSRAPNIHVSDNQLQPGSLAGALRVAQLEGALAHGVPRASREMRLFRDQAAVMPVQECPTCGKSITFQASADGCSVDVLHPQPPCAGFKDFVEKLFARHREGLS